MCNKRVRFTFAVVVSRPQHFVICGAWTSHRCWLTSVALLITNSSAAHSINSQPFPTCYRLRAPLHGHARMSMHVQCLVGIHCIAAGCTRLPYACCPGRVDVHYCGCPTGAASQSQECPAIFCVIRCGCRCCSPVGAGDTTVELQGHS